MNYEILGQQIVTEMAGADAPGFDRTLAINSASELLTRGLNEYDNKKKSDADKANLDKAVTQDAVWASALANVELAQKANDSSKLMAAQSVATSAEMTARNIGSGLSSDSAQKRLDAAQAVMNRAANEVLKDSKSDSANARLHAWQKVVAAIPGQTASSSSTTALATTSDSGGHGGGISGNNFLTRRYAGVPVWGWGLGGVVAITGTVLLVKALRK